MFATLPTSFTNTPTSKSSVSIKQQTTSLLHKIESLQIQIQGNKSKKFKSFIAEISSLEGSVNQDISAKRKLYDGLLSKISQIGRESQEQDYIDGKVRLMILNKLQSFVKNNEKAFDKLKNERINSQERLQNFLDSKIQTLNRKYQNIIIPEIPLKEYHQELQILRQQVSKFFKQAEKQQQKTKSLVFSLIEECSLILKQDQTQRAQTEALELMKVIHLQILNRVKNLQGGRQRMQEQVLSALERAYEVVLSGATSTLM